MAFNEAYQVDSYSWIHSPSGLTCSALAASDPTNYACVDDNNGNPNLSIQTNGQHQSCDFIDPVTSDIHHMTSVSYIGSKPADR